MDIGNSSQTRTPDSGTILVSWIDKAVKFAAVKNMTRCEAPYNPFSTPIKEPTWICYKCPAVMSCAV